jgi:SH3-like domain-containing protein
MAAKIRARLQQGSIGDQNTRISFPNWRKKKTGAWFPVVLALLLAGCHKASMGPPPLGEAFVGPATLSLRSDIPLQSPPVGIVKHGEKVEIVQRRRSFLKVRGPNGTEGWTEERQLLAAADMTVLKEMAARAATMASQGRATTDADLRVHMQPSAKSPSFLTIKEKGNVEVLAQLVRTRTDLPRTPLIPTAPKKQTTPKKPKKEPKIPLLPMPTPPPPPANWLDLSKTELPDDSEETSSAPPLPTDNWSLVRAPDGQAGWVLTRRLRMAISDEVAQYAEGRRIVSYFSLGSVQDDDQKKDIWLWTTIAGQQDYEFDSFRVFVWSVRRHRYETQYIERNLKGFGPVLVGSVHSQTAKGKASSADQSPGFSLCVEKQDGQRYRRDYSLIGTSIRFAGDRPCEAPQPLDIGGPQAAPATVSAPVQPQEPWMQRMKKRVKSLFGH